MVAFDELLILFFYDSWFYQNHVYTIIFPLLQPLFFHPLEIFLVKTSNSRVHLIKNILLQNLWIVKFCMKITKVIQTKLKITKSFKNIHLKGKKSRLWKYENFRKINFKDKKLVNKSYYLDILC